jgi:hypothetical protein
MEAPVLSALLAITKRISGRLHAPIVPATLAQAVCLRTQAMRGKLLRKMNLMTARLMLATQEKGTV